MLIQNVYYFCTSKSQMIFLIECEEERHIKKHLLCFFVTGKFGD